MEWQKFTHELASKVHQQNKQYAKMPGIVLISADKIQGAIANFQIDTVGQCLHHKLIEPLAQYQKQTKTTVAAEIPQSNLVSLQKTLITAIGNELYKTVAPQFKTTATQPTSTETIKTICINTLKHYLKEQNQHKNFLIKLLSPPSEIEVLIKNAIRALGAIA